MHNFFLALCLCCLTTVWTQNVDVKKIDQLLESKVKAGAPGLALGIVQNGVVVYERYLGLANLQHQIPVDAQTQFNLASVAKQFTALCVLKLILENKLSLEADIRQYLPELYKQLKTPIPLKTLLNHSSGIRDFYDLLSIQGKPWWRQEGLDNEDALALLTKQQSLNFNPNTSYLYSNSNYTLLAAIVAKVSGKPFADYSKQVFQDLGMSNTQFCTNYMQVIPFQALPYNDWGDGAWQQYPMMTNLHADGFLYTTLKDQLVFEQAIQKDEQRRDPLLILSQKSIPGTQNQEYGYGLELNKVNGHPAVQHSGSTGSYNAHTLRFPAEKLSIVVLSNNGNLWSGSIARQVAALILEPLEERKAETPEAPAASAPEKVIGQYRSTNDNITRVTWQEGFLYWQMDNNNPRKLLPITGNLYRWERDENMQVAFYHDTDPAKRHYVLYEKGEKPSKHQKLVPFTPNFSYLKACSGRYVSTELEMGLDIRLTPENQLLLKRDGVNYDTKIEVLQANDLLASDYKMRLERDTKGQIKAILLTYNRVKNLRFEKTK